jgi:uroporphyrinogen-III synthase
LKVFLSRDNPSEALVNHAQKSGWELTCFSCIQKSITTSESPPEADWIFFYSPSAVRFYAKYFERSFHRLAALGEGTGQAMHEYDMKPEFVGSSANPSEVVAEFGQILTTKERVVQARGEKSFERLREALNSEQIIDWPFYRSDLIDSIPLIEADYYIFTSPSNAEAYLAKHLLPREAIVVVFGESTKAFVEINSKNQILMAPEPGEKSAALVIEEDIK